MKACSVLIVVIMISLGVSCSGPESAPTEYESYLDRAEEIWGFRGAYLVARGDSILARGGRGPADAEQNRPVTADTRFLIGSMTKPFTAIAVMQLVEQGLIDPFQTVATYLPDYPADAAKRITVHHLLAHRSGIPDLVSNPEFARRISAEMRPDEIVSYFRDLPLSFEPDQEYEYSSSNYILLGLIIEAVSGKSWEQYIEDHICGPVGMANTGVAVDYFERPDFAVGYGPGPSGALTKAPAFHPECGYAAGSLASNVDDLYALHLALYDTLLLKSETIETMLFPHSPDYGYGWMVDDFGDHRLTTHGGGVPGYVSIWQRWVDDSVCVIVLSNNVTVAVHNIANALAAIALGEPYEMPRVKTPAVIDAAGYDEYVGDYRMPEGDMRCVIREGDQLLVQRGFGRPYYIQPEAADIFYFVHDHMTTLTFYRDSAGAVAGHILRQSFDADTAQRITNER